MLSNRISELVQPASIFGVIHWPSVCITDFLAVSLSLRLGICGAWSDELSRTAHEPFCDSICPWTNRPAPFVFVDVFTPRTASRYVLLYTCTDIYGICVCAVCARVAHRVRRVTASDSETLARSFVTYRHCDMLMYISMCGLSINAPTYLYVLSDYVGSRHVCFWTAKIWRWTTEWDCRCFYHRNPSTVTESGICARNCANWRMFQFVCDRYRASQPPKNVMLCKQHGMAYERQPAKRRS